MVAYSFENTLANDGTTGSLYDAVLRGTSGFAPSFRGTGIQLVSANAAVLVGAGLSGPSLGSAWTLSLWFKDAQAKAGIYRTLFRGGVAHHPLLADVNSDAVGTYDNSGAGFRQFGTYTLTAIGNDGNWHHMVVVGQGGSTTLYVDGEAVGVSAFQSQADILLLGNEPTGTNQRFSDYIDEFLFYDTAFNASQVYDLHNAYVCVPTTTTTSTTSTTTSTTTSSTTSTTTTTTTNTSNNINIIITTVKLPNQHYKSPPPPQPPHKSHTISTNHRPPPTTVKYSHATTTTSALNSTAFTRSSTQTSANCFTFPISSSFYFLFFPPFCRINALKISLFLICSFSVTVHRCLFVDIRIRLCFLFQVFGIFFRWFFFPPPVDLNANARARFPLPPSTLPHSHTPTLHPNASSGRLVHALWWSTMPMLWGA